MHLSNFTSRGNSTSDTKMIIRNYVERHAWTKKFIPKNSNYVSIQEKKLQVVFLSER